MNKNHFNIKGLTMKIFFAAVFCFFLLTTAYSQDKFLNTEKFDAGRDPVKDLADAVTFAKTHQVRILMEVGGEWCSWCKRLNKFIEDRKSIKDVLYPNYAFLRVNYSKEQDNAAFLSTYPKISGYPHIFILDQDGTLIHSQNTEELEEGKSYSEEKIIQFLKKWTAEKK